jgi:5-methyltetrahydropteroyltriglutamate--homocysteine methyltransferase
MSNRSRPPFRAEHVGSFLRPQAVLNARAKFQNKQISATQLREIEDAAIHAAVKRQEDIGMQAVTDGELRRGTWHMDFLCRIGGVVQGGSQNRPFHNETGDVSNEIALPKVVDRLHLEKPIFGDDFAFLKSVTTAIPKLTIPAPSLLHGLGITVGENDVYRDEVGLLADLVRVYADQVRLLEEIGCTYLQIDDTMFATLGDPSYRDKIRTSSANSENRHLIYIDLINGAIARRSSKLAVCVHTCRGNHRSAWVAEGGYDFVAEAVFNKLDVDGFFLEYDDARSGTFEPLRFVPKNKRVILGLVTTKKGKLESKDDLKRRIDEAAKFIELDQLSLSPQCGFASTLQGNLLSEDEQYAKLELVVETAREVWGRA